MKRYTLRHKLILSTLLLFFLITGVAYGSNTSKIEVSFENLKYLIQGKQVQADAKAPGFIYKGTTYVPLRFIGESLGQEVIWDGKSKTISMTGKGGNPSTDVAVKEAYQKEIESMQAQIDSLTAELNALKESGGSGNDAVVSYVTYKHGNYTLNFTPTAYKDYSYLHTEFETITKHMFQYFNVKDVSFPVNVYIQSKKDRNDRPNSGAFYESGERVIVINADDNFEMAGHNSVKFVFVHELSHSLQDSAWGFDVLHKVTGGEKNWILEGHADYIAKKLSGYSQYGVRGGDPAGDARTQEYYVKELHYRNGPEGWKPLDWSSIDTFQRLSLHRDEYFAFEAIVNFIATKYSLEHYNLMLEEMAKGKDGASAIQAVFKKTDQALMEEYKVFYKLK